MKLDELNLNQRNDQQKTRIVQSIFVGGKMFSVSGTGYNPHGNIYCDRYPIDPWSLLGLEECLIAGLLCNNSQLIKQNKNWIAMGDLDEVAMITLAHKAGLERSQFLEVMPRLDELTSITEFNRQATLHDYLPVLRKHIKHHHVIYIKATGNLMLSSCKYMLDLNGKLVMINMEEIILEIEAIQNEGLDVIMLTKKIMPIDYHYLNSLDLISDLIFIGCMGIEEFGIF